MGKPNVHREKEGTVMGGKTMVLTLSQTSALLDIGYRLCSKQNILSVSHQALFYWLFTCTELSGNP